MFAAFSANGPFAKKSGAEFLSGPFVFSRGCSGFLSARSAGDTEGTGSEAEAASTGALASLPMCLKGQHALW